MRLLATFEQVVTTSGTAILLVLICSHALRRFWTVGEFGWWLGVGAVGPGHILLFGWVLVALIWAAWHRQSMSKKFLVIWFVNCLVALAVILGRARISV